MDAKSLNPKILSTLGQGGAVFGVALNHLAQSHDKLLVLSADMSTTAGLDKFKAGFPDRFYNLGIAEQNMIGVAAGLSDEGYRTVSVAQACFLTMRCFEQVRQYVGYMHTPQILVGIGSGYSLGVLGGTHYALEDLALMRTLPEMTVIAPCDALQAAKAFEAAVEHDGPVYIRLFGGGGVPAVYTSDFDYTIGRTVTLHEGDDVAVVSCGSMVYEALKAARILAENGILAQVIDMHTLRPLDGGAINTAARLVVTVEEHRATGGLGDAVADYLSPLEQRPRLLKIAATDTFGPAGSTQYLREQAGLTAEQIARKIIKNL